MIDYEAENWVKIILSVRGSVLPRLTVRMLIAGVIGGVALLIDKWNDFHIEPTAHALIGVALGLLLVFRTNASYDRFWEGRKLVGRLVIAARDLMRQVVTYVDDVDGHREHLRRKILAFYYLSVQRLREEDDLGELEEVLTGEERAVLEEVTHRPQVVATWISARLARMVEHHEAHVTELRLNRMDQTLSELNEALAGCERIRFTPVPFAYAQHIKVFLALFCYTAPFAMVHGMVWWTPVASAVLALALFGIDEIGVEIEDPFGDDPNDLPMEDIGEALEKSTLEMMNAEPHGRVAPAASSPSREPRLSVGGKERVESTLQGVGEPLA